MSCSFINYPSLQKTTIFTQLFKKQPTFSTICSKILAIHKNWKYMTRFNIKLVRLNNILYCHKQSTYILSLFKYISSASMMPRVVVDDHLQKTSPTTLTLLTASCTPSRWSLSSIVTMGSSTLSTCFFLCQLHWSFFTAATTPNSSLVFLHGRHCNVDSFST